MRPALATPLEHTLSKLALLLVAAVAGLLIVVIYIRLSGGHSVIFDDAYMYVRYSLNFWNHGVFGWNPDEASYGCTSLLYALWVTVWTPVISPSWQSYQLFLMGSSLLFSLLGVWLLIKITKQYFPSASSSWMWILPLICSFPFLGNSLNGMDTSMSFAALSLMVLVWSRAEHSPSNRKLFLLAFASVLPFLVRPDNGFYVLLIPLIMTWKKWDRSSIIRVYLFLSLLVSADLLLKFWLFGSPLPLPFFSKSDAAFHAYRGMTMWPLDQYWLYFLTIAGLPILAGIMTGHSPIPLRPLLLLIPVLLTLLVLSSKIMVMGGHMRFFYPSVVVMMSAGFMLMKRNRIDQRMKLLILVWAGIAFGGIFLSEIQDRRVEAEELELVLLANPDSGTEVEDMYPVDVLYQVLESLPKGSMVAGSEHGRLSVQFSDLRIFDLMGLHDRHIAHQGYSDEYLSRQRPEVIWMAHDHYVGLNHQILAGSYFQEAYEFFPGAAQYGMAIRKDLDQFQDLKAIILSEGQDSSTNP